jgi:WD40 repeat protein
LVDVTGTAISTSYDGSLLVWNLGNKEVLQGLFKGHKDAVTTFEWSNSLVVSGGRDGTLAFWDINEGKAFKKLKAHEGAVSKIKFYDDGADSNIIITAGLNDGVVCMHDMRTNKLASSEQVHRGAINMLETSNSNMIITGSGDKTMKQFDIMNGYK